MNIKKKRLKRWKVGEVRIRKAKGGYGFYCCCGSYTTTRKGDKLKLEKCVKGFLYHGKCSNSKCNSWVVLEHM